MAINKAMDSSLPFGGVAETKVRQVNIIGIMTKVKARIPDEAS